MIDIVNLENFLSDHGIYFELYHHQPMYTYEESLAMKEAKGFTGTETKALFLKGKDGTYYSYLTIPGQRTDFKALKHLVGQKLSFVQPEDMENLTGQPSGAVVPFGYERQVPLIINGEILDHERIVFAPARPDQTMVVQVKDLKEIISLLGNDYYIETSDPDKTL